MVVARNRNLLDENPEIWNCENCVDSNAGLLNEFKLTVSIISDDDASNQCTGDTCTINSAHTSNIPPSLDGDDFEPSYYLSIAIAVLIFMAFVRVLLRFFQKKKPVRAPTKISAEPVVMPRWKTVAGKGVLNSSNVASSFAGQNDASNETRSSKLFVYGEDELNCIKQRFSRPQLSPADCKVESEIRRTALGSLLLDRYSIHNDTWSQSFLGGSSLDDLPTLTVLDIHMSNVHPDQVSRLVQMLNNRATELTHQLAVSMQSNKTQTAVLAALMRQDEELRAQHEEACTLHAKELSACQKKLKKLQNELEESKLTARTDYAALAAKHQEKTDVASRLTAEAVIAADTIKSLRAELSSSTNLSQVQFSEVMSDLEDTRGALLAINEQNETLTAEVAARVTELTALKQENEGWQQNCRELQSRMIALVEESERSENSVKELTTSLADQTKQVDVLRTEKEDLNKKLELTLQSLNELVISSKNEEKSLAATISEQNSRMDQLYNSLKVTGANYNTKAAHLTEQLRAKDVELVALQGQISALTEKCDTYESEADRLKKEAASRLEQQAAQEALIGKLESEKRFLQQNASDLESSLSSLESEKSNWLSEKDTLSSQLRDALRDAEEQCDRASELELRLAETDKENQEQLEQSRSEWRDAQSEIRALRERLEDCELVLDQSRDDSESQALMLSRLEEELNIKKAAYKSQMASSDQKTQQTMEALQQSISALTADNGVLSSTITALNESNQVYLSANQALEATAKQIKAELLSSREEVTKLNEQNKSLLGSVEDLTATNSHIAVQVVGSLQQKVDAVTADLKQLTADHDKAQQQLKIFEQLLDSSSEKLKATTERNQSLESLLAASSEEATLKALELENALAALKADCEEQLSALLVANEQIKSLETKDNILRNTTDRLNSELTAAQELVKVNQQTLREWEEKLQSWNDERLQLTEELQKRDCDCSELKKALEENHTSLGEIETLNKQLASDLKQSQDDLVSVKEEYEAKINQLKSDISALQGIVDDKQLQLSQLNDANAELNDQIRLLTESVDHLRSANDLVAFQLDEKTALLVETTQRNVDLKEELTQSKLESASLVKQNDELMLRLKDSQDLLSSEVEESAKKCFQLKELVVSLEDTIRGLQTESSDASAEIADLRSKLSESESQLRATHDENAALLSSVRGLRVERDADQAELVNSQRSISELKEQVRLLSEALDHLKSTNVKVALELDEKTSELVKVTQSCMNLSDELIQERLENESLLQELNNLNESVLHAEKQAIDLNAKLKETSEQKSLLMSDLAEKLVMLDQLRAENADLQDTSRVLGESVDHLKVTNVEVALQLDEKMATVVETTQRCMDLNDELNQAKLEISSLKQKLEIQENDVKDANNQVDELKSKLESLTLASEESDKIIHQLKVDFQTLEADRCSLLAELKDKLMLVDQLHTVNAELDGHIRGLNDTVDRLRATNVEVALQLDEKMSKVVEVTQSNLDLQSQVETFKAKLHQTEQEKAAVQLELDQQFSEYELCANKLSEAAKSLLEMTRKNDRLTDKTQRLEALLTANTEEASAKMNELETSVDSITLKNSEHLDTIESLKRKVDTLVFEAQERDIVLGDLRAEVFASEESAEKLRSEVTDLKAENKILKGTVKLLNDQLLAGSEVNSRNMTEVEQLRDLLLTIEQSNNDLTAQVETLTSDLHVKESVVSDSFDKVLQLTAANDELRRQLRLSEDFNAEKLQQLSELRDQIASEAELRDEERNTSKEESKKEVAILLDEYEKLQTEYEELREKYAEVQQLLLDNDQKLLAAKKELVELNGAHDETQEQLRDSKHLLEQHQKRIGDVESRNAESQSVLQEKVLSLQTQCEDLTAQLAECQMNLEHSVRQWNEQNQELQDCKTLSSESVVKADVAVQRAAFLEGELKQSEEFIGNMTMEFEKIVTEKSDKLLAALTMARENELKYSEQISTLKTDNAALAEKIDKMNLESSFKQSEIDAQMKFYKDTQAELLGYRAAQAQSPVNSNALEAKLGIQTKLIDKLKLDVKTLTQENGDLKAGMHAIQKELHSTKQEVKELKDEALKKAKETDELLDNLTSDRDSRILQGDARYKGAQLQVNALEEALNDSQVRVMELRETVEGLEKQLKESAAAALAAASNVENHNGHKDSEEDKQSELVETALRVHVQNQESVIMQLRFEITEWEAKYASLVSNGGVGDLSTELQKQKDLLKAETDNTENLLQVIVELEQHEKDLEERLLIANERIAILEKDLDDAKQQVAIYNDHLNNAIQQNKSLLESRTPPRSPQKMKSNGSFKELKEDDPEALLIRIQKLEKELKKAQSRADSKYNPVQEMNVLKQQVLDLQNTLNYERKESRMFEDQAEDIEQRHRAEVNAAVEEQRMQDQLALDKEKAETAQARHIIVLRDAEIVRLEGQLNETQHLLDETKQVVDKRTIELEDLRKASAADKELSSQTIAEMQISLESLEMELSSTQEQLNSCEGTILDHVRFRNDLQMELGSTTLRLNEVTAEKDLLANRLFYCEGDLSNAMNTIFMNEAHVREVVQTIALLTNQKDELEAASTQHVEQFEKDQKLIDYLNAHIEDQMQLSCSFQMEIEVKNNEILDLHKQQEEQAKLLSEKTEECSKLAVELEDVNRVYSDLKVECEELRLALKKCEDKAVKWKNLSDEIEGKAKSSAVELKQLMTVERSQLNDLLSAQRDEIAVSKATIDTLQSEVDNTNRIMFDLQHSQQEEKAQADKKAAVQKNLINAIKLDKERLQNELTTKDLELKKKGDVIEKTTRSVDQLTLKLNATQKHCLELETDLEASKAEVNELKAQLETLSIQFREREEIKNNLIAQIRKEGETITSVLKDTQSSGWSDKNVTINACKETIQQLESQLWESRKIIMKLNSEHNELYSCVEFAQEKVKELLAEVEFHKEVINTLQAQLDARDAEISSLQESLKTSTADLDIATGLADEMRDVNQSLNYSACSMVDDSTAMDESVFGTLRNGDDSCSSKLLCAACHCRLNSGRPPIADISPVSDATRNAWSSESVLLASSQLPSGRFSRSNSNASTVSSSEVEALASNITDQLLQIQARIDSGVL